jgi:GNAT superfamily N-acetyltransferase
VRRDRGFGARYRVAVPAVIRPATPADVPEVLAMIRDLAAYEESLHQVETTATQLSSLLFGGTGDVEPAAHHGSPAAFCHVVVDADVVPGTQLAGFALWFLNASTWTGTHGVYLEDLYVRPEARGRGYGRDLLATLARICTENGYRRLDWGVLDWNEPSLDFYAALGAGRLDEWVGHRLTGDALAALAATRPESG